MTTPLSTLPLTRSEERAFEAAADEYVRVQTRRYPPTTLARQVGHMNVSTSSLLDSNARKPVRVDAETVRHANRMLERMDYAPPYFGLALMMSVIPALYTATHSPNVALVRALFVFPILVAGAALVLAWWIVVKGPAYQRTIEAAALAEHPVVALPGGVTEAVEDHREALQRVRLTTRDPQVLVAAAESEQNMERLVSEAPRMGALWGEDDVFDADVYHAYYAALVPFTEQVYALAGQSAALQSLVESRG